MKNQYTGDVNDYIKYGLLRLLSDPPVSLFVCWMLTSDDNRADGMLIKYISRPELWRHYDPPLFDALKKRLGRSQQRTVRWIGSPEILPSARFHSAILTDHGEERCRYFEEMRSMLGNSSLVFFDPDNGIEVNSVRRGRRGSSRYLYLDEVMETYSTGRSVLVYQHFPRVRRSSYISGMIERIRHFIRPAGILSFASSRVLYILCSRPEQYHIFRERCQVIRARWGDLLQVQFHPDGDVHIWRR